MPASTMGVSIKKNLAKFNCDLYELIFIHNLITTWNMQSVFCQWLNMKN